MYSCLSPKGMYKNVPNFTVQDRRYLEMMQMSTESGMAVVPGWDTTQQRISSCG